MKAFLVTLEGSSREVYYVEADSVEDARILWSSGQLEVSEAYGMEVVSVVEQAV